MMRSATHRAIPPATYQFAIGIALAVAASPLPSRASGQALSAAAGQGPGAFRIITSLLRFWNVNGAPIAIVQYALVARKAVDTVSEPSIAATIVLRQIGAAHEVADTSWRQEIDRTAIRPADRVTAGYVVVPLRPWLIEWSLTARYPGTTDPGDGETRVGQPLPAGSIVVSDLALGAPPSANVWQFGAQRVLLELSDVFARKVPVHLFYQTRSEASHDDVRTYITCTDISDAKMGKRVLQVSFDGRLDPGINVSERELDMSHMKSGRYQVELQVGDQHGGGASVRMTTFTVK
jgi:hypothetical protein